jgi:excisionase family DNA binding protein
MKQDFIVSSQRGAAFLRVHIAAERIGCSRRTVRRLIQMGKLPAQREGQRAWIIPRRDVEAFCMREALSC